MRSFGSKPIGKLTTGFSMEDESSDSPIVDFPESPGDALSEQTFPCSPYQGANSPIILNNNNNVTSKCEQKVSKSFKSSIKTNGETKEESRESNAEMSRLQQGDVSIEDRKAQQSYSNKAQCNGITTEKSAAKITVSIYSNLV